MGLLEFLCQTNTSAILHHLSLTNTHIYTNINYKDDVCFLFLFLYQALKNVNLLHSMHRRNIGDFFISPRKKALTFRTNDNFHEISKPIFFRTNDNLLEMSILIFWESKKKYFKMSSAVIFTLNICSNHFYFFFFP